MTFRQYQPIWDKLKQLPKKDAEQIGISVSAPSTLHKRIIKAVKKEKWKDLAYKLRLEPRVATLNHSRRGVILTFTLSFNLTTEDF